MTTEQLTEQSLPSDNLGFDMDNALADISEGLGFESEAPDTDVDLDVTLPGQEGTSEADKQATPSDTPEQPAPVTLPEPPKTWRKEATATWAALPTAARTEILKREEDIFQGIESYKADASLGKSFKSTLEPYSPFLASQGIDPVQQVSSLMQAHYTLAAGSPEQKSALLQQLASQYNIPLPYLYGDEAEAPYVDPQVKNLQNQLNGLQSKQEATERARLVETQQNFLRQVEAFSADPANTYFSEVANDMVKLLESKVCSSLQDAYQQAIWHNPVTRQKEIDRQQADALTKAKTEEATRVAEARKATAANVRTSAKSGSAATPAGSLDDTLQETLRAIRSRA